MRIQGKVHWVPELLSGCGCACTSHNCSAVQGRRRPPICLVASRTSRHADLQEQYTTVKTGPHRQPSEVCRSGILNNIFVPTLRGIYTKYTLRHMLVMFYRGATVRLVITVYTVNCLYGLLFILFITIAPVTSLISLSAMLI